MNYSLHTKREITAYKFAKYIKKVCLEFDSEKTRNDYLDTFFPNRECLDTPGMYDTKNATIHVRYLDVTVYSKEDTGESNDTIFEDNEYPKGE